MPDLTYNGFSTHLWIQLPSYFVYKDSNLLSDLITNLRDSVFKKMPDLWEHFQAQKTLSCVEGTLMDIGMDNIYMALFLVNIVIY
jgi:hypothetical protein